MIYVLSNYSNNSTCVHEISVGSKGLLTNIQFCRFPFNDTKSSLDHSFTIIIIICNKKKKKSLIPLSFLKITFNSIYHHRQGVLHAVISWKDLCMNTLLPLGYLIVFCKGYNFHYWYYLENVYKWIELL